MEFNHNYPLFVSHFVIKSADWNEAIAYHSCVPIWAYTKVHFNYHLDQLHILTYLQDMKFSNTQDKCLKPDPGQFFILYF